MQKRPFLFFLWGFQWKNSSSSLLTVSHLAALQTETCSERQKWETEVGTNVELNPLNYCHILLKFLHSVSSIHAVFSGIKMLICDFPWNHINIYLCRSLVISVFIIQEREHGLTEAVWMFCGCADGNRSMKSHIIFKAANKVDSLNLPSIHSVSSGRRDIF